MGCRFGIRRFVKNRLKNNKNLCLGGGFLLPVVLFAVKYYGHIPFSGQASPDLRCCGFRHIERLRLPATHSTRKEQRKLNITCPTRKKHRDGNPGYL